MHLDDQNICSSVISREQTSHTKIATLYLCSTADYDDFLIVEGRHALCSIKKIYHFLHPDVPVAM